MAEEWGPWIDHDGRGCPVPNGTIVHCLYMGGYEIIAAVSANGRDDDLNPWVFKPIAPSIIRYRIRKPKGLTILQNLLENLPQGVDA